MLIYHKFNCDNEFIEYHKVLERIQAAMQHIFDLNEGVLSG